MLRTTLMIALALSGAAQAKTLNIATDIAPIHSLVSSVVGDKQDVSLVVPQGADLHNFSLLPKQAGQLQSADVVFYIGASLLPWFSQTVQTLSSTAQLEALEMLNGAHILDMRAQAALAHDHEAEGNDDHDDHDGHGDDHDDHDGHGVDPHLWLDVDNARLILGHVASVLGGHDPENAAYYTENATRLSAEIEAFGKATISRFSAHTPNPFLVGHDAFQYFEEMLGVSPSGFITDALGTAPTIQIMQDLSVSNATCILADENEMNPHSQRIAETIGAKIVTANPVGSRLELGPELYMKLMQNLANDFADCLGG